jgi:hypothetical protein
MSPASGPAASTEGVPDVRVAVDSVRVAEATPDVEQPWSELGLREEEYGRVRDILGRRPTAAELAMYSVMWSEHCSYKSSKVHLRRFGEATPAALANGSTRMLAGIGENAGVVDIGDGWAVTFKAESHNHPSFVEPYQGAATGVGGIIRDIIAMGARPVAVMDSLRFGAVDHPDTARVVHGVVAGVGGYGNCIGLPNIGGEVYFDPCYQGNPLVNALCVGAMRHEDLHLANATGLGNVIVLFGARTGGDGIGGVSVLASETFDVGADGTSGPSKRPAVQVGDPFREKLLIECCLDLFHAGVVEGIQDLGGAGAVVRDQRARLRRRRRHARRAGEGAAARRLAAARGDPHERVAGTDDGGRPARPARRVPRHHRRGGRSSPPSWARSPTPAAWRSRGTGRRSWTCRRARSRTRARSTSAPVPARGGSTPARRTAPRTCPAPPRPRSCASS